jgi:hypothetical protein
MPLRTSTILKFERYYVLDSNETKLEFSCTNPGAGEESLYWIVLTDDEISTIIDALTYDTLISDKLKRKYRSANISTKLDRYFGRETTI